MQTKTPRALRIAAVASAIVFTLAYIVTGRESTAMPLQTGSQSKNPLKPTDRNTALGLDHYDAHCASCHGSSGKADTEKGKTLKAADLTDPATQSKSDAELFRVISKGIPGSGMPAFGKTHSPTEIWQAILFVRKLPSLTADERKKLESEVPADARHKHHPENSEHKHPDGTAAQTEAHHHDAAAPTPSPSSGPPAQPAAQEQHHHEPAQQTQKPAATQQPHEHDMSKMGEAEQHSHGSSPKLITGGPFGSMSAIGSGTSLLPSAAPGYMWHWMKNDWMIMAHGDLKTGFDHQGGPRGVNKAESQNWFMLMAERPVGPGELMLRGMFSAEPWTAPRRGFPELLQTGETFERRPIIDAQHPHDLFMELAAAYNIKLSENVALNFYGGPVGEPALGPVAFMHRMSASENPAAPLGHHWQDSTHITGGVITAGVTAWRFRVEGSAFHGAEPDEQRKDIETGKLDSWSGRVWFTPTPNWAMQFSYGHLVHPEAIEPGDVKRMTASIAHNRSWADGNLATSLIWGRNEESHGNSNSYLLESTGNFLDKNYLYTRMELVDKAGLLEENIFGRRGLDEFDQAANGFEIGDRFDDMFRVGAFTFGGVRDLVANSEFRLGIGADVTFYHLPDQLTGIYGSKPTSYHVFLRIRPGKMHN